MGSQGSEFAYSVRFGYSGLRDSARPKPSPDTFGLKPGLQWARGGMEPIGAEGLPQESCGYSDRG